MKSGSDWLQHLGLNPFLSDWNKTEICLFVQGHCLTKTFVFAKLRSNTEFPFSTVESSLLLIELFELFISNVRVQSYSFIQLNL